MVIFQLIDDHSRFEVFSLAWPLEDTAGAWAAFSRALTAGYGPPAMVLSDNGTAFTGKHVNRIVRFEKNLAALGVRLINSRPYHPQTCGKNERAHRTLRRWLALHHPTTIAELQALLDAYRPLFNDRPHQGIDGKTPTQRRLSGLRRTPRPTAEVSLPNPIQAYTYPVSSRGVVHHSTYSIRLGTEYAGQTVTAYRTGLDMTFFYRDHLIATITIDPTRSNQPTTNNHQGKRIPLPQ